MSSLAVKSLHTVVPGCVSASVDRERFSLIFRSEAAADAFISQMEAALKADEIMAAHCKPFIPQGFKSCKEYMAQMGVKNYLVYEVEFDDHYDVAQLFRAIASYYEK